MTVYKPIKQEADAAAELAARWPRATRQPPTHRDGDRRTTRGQPEGPVGAAHPEPITKDNVKAVIDDGHVKASEVCTAATQARLQAARHPVAPDAARRSAAGVAPRAVMSRTPPIRASRRSGP